jgi:hypothetical protein
MKKIFLTVAVAMFAVLGASAQDGDIVFAKSVQNIRIGYAGVANASNSNLAGGVDLGVNIIQIGVKPYSTGAITVGADFLMDTYHPTKDHYFLTVDHRTVIVPTIFTKTKYSGSTVLGFGIPLDFTQKIGRNLAITLGAAARINLNASTRLVYADSDKKWHTERASGIHTNRVTYDLHCSVDVDGFGIYAAYAPMNVFEDGYGPSFNMFSVGLIFKH